MCENSDMLATYIKKYIYIYILIYSLFLYIKFIYNINYMNINIDM